MNVFRKYFYLYFDYILQIMLPLLLKEKFNYLLNYELKKKTTNITLNNIITVIRIYSLIKGKIKIVT